MADGEALFKELLDTFRLEAQDHLGAMASLLVTLENESDATQHRGLVESLFRRMHTLKGAAHAVNLDSVAKLCQELEDLLAGVKRGELPLDGLLFDRLHDELDALSALAVEQVVTGAGSSPDALRPLPPAPFPPVGTDPPSPAPLQGEAEAVEKPVAAGADPERRPAQQEKGAGDTVRVSTRLLEALLLQAEELVSAKLTASSLSAEVTALSAELTGRAPAVLRALDLAREALRKGQQDPENGKLANLLQERCSDQLAAENRLRALEKSALKQVRSLQSLVDPLLDDVKKLHLLPFSSLTDPFAKLVRDLGRELGKEAELSCSGCEIEVDRRILAELKEPLLHLVRNVMDHGIEKAEQRKAFGKPARGRISIEVRLQDANLAEVLVSDDGRGIEVTQVKGAALRMELLPAEVLAAMSNAEALQLIFESGISTSPIITNLSGRGVGLAIVRESVEKLGGHVTVTSQPGQATVFSLLLPLSFAMLRALLVESAGRPCFLPAANVELAGRFSRDEIRSVENRDTVLIGGAITPVVSLARLLELAEPAPELPPGLQAMVLLNGAGKRIAFAVDQVVEVQEILVKPLGNQLSRVRNVAGATVLGDGRVIQVLNVGDLFRSALLAAGSGLPLSLPLTPAADRKPLSVLVAEDSITSRTLLKNILESAGFLVQTAVDGADALATLKSGEFDVVVSDVEMPRMDGFQLTAAIRAEKRLEGLPVILVTGLESRSDRERGIDVGANAYVVKSSFDQGSLIEVIRKLT